MPPNSGPLVAEQKSNGRKTWWYSKQAEAYGRASGIGKYLDDASNLIPWAACQAAIGTVLDKSARSEIVSLINEFDRDPWGGGGKDRLKSAVDKARQTAGAEVASTAGTEFHQYTELIDMGKTPTIVQDEFVPLVDKYVAATEPLEFLDAEPFVVCDELKVAGSIDRIVRVPKLVNESGDVHPISGKVVVADLKSGRHDNRYGLKPTVQVACYANSVRYDQASGVRSPIHEDLSTDWGLLLHFPIMMDDPQVGFYPLDLRFGWQAACVALWVKELRKPMELKRLEVAA